MKNIDIIGGGTIYHVRNHLALTASAYGNTARHLHHLCLPTEANDVNLHLTKMANAGQGYLETNEDISKLVDQLITNPQTHIIFFNPALVDYEGFITEPGYVGYQWDDIPTVSGKYEERLKTSEGEQQMLLKPAEKILKKIRQQRKDIFLVAFKTTCGANPDEQFLTGLHLLKSNSCNLVLANDTQTRLNMIITPEQARYHVSTDREMVLQQLVKMAISRANGTFTRSTVVDGESVPWNMDNIPHSLKAVVDHCIAQGAYKPFKGSTVGHFAFKKDQTDFITSKRRTNFNQLDQVGMVRCQAVSEDAVVAYGAKPSVGGQSQRIIFREHPEMDCIVHFHCPVKSGVNVSTRSQAEHECGSHQCGQNTSDGLKEVAPGIKCVFLDNHGPNIVFNHKTNPQEVINYIDQHFDLAKSTDQIDRNATPVS
jgi:hypothetical protein